MTAFDQQTQAQIMETAAGWRRSGMEAAYRVFASLDEPTGVEEDWRYVDFDLSFSELRPVLKAGEPLQAGPFLKPLASRSGDVVIVDGIVIEAASDSVRVSRLSDLDEDPGFDSGIPVDHNKLAAAHGAFAGDGVLIDVPAGAAPDSPIVIQVQGVTADTATFPYLLVRLGDSAEAQVLVVYRSAPDARLLMVPHVELDVGNGANLRLLTVQALDHAATVVVHQRALLARDATVRLGEVGLGGRLGRLDLRVDLVGDGCSSEVVGLYFGEGSQTLDYRMVIDHHGKNTTSDVFLKGAVEDDAQSVFTGLLRIEKDATRTSTFETNRNLVLSENAKAHSVPNLEILCDDVMCGHGSSVGPLEQEHLYYLQSRGLSRPRAERLLIRGFFQEVVDRLPIDGLEAPVSEEVFRRFVTAQEEGRVV